MSSLIRRAYTRSSLSIGLRGGRKLDMRGIEVTSDMRTGGGSRSPGEQRFGNPGGVGFGTGYSMLYGWQGTAYFAPHELKTPDRFLKMSRFQHFNTERWYERMSPIEFLRHQFKNAYTYYTCFSWTALLYYGGMLISIWIWTRREPAETNMDREEFFQDYWSNHYGHYYNSDRMADRNSLRRAKKWGYDEQTGASDRIEKYHRKMGKDCEL